MKIAPKYLGLYYFSGLLIFTLISIASYFVLVNHLSKQRELASIISSSAKQKMLSQRIASLVTQYRLGNKKILKDLKKSLEEFKENHQSLLSVYESKIIPKQELRTIYYGYEISLSNTVNIYVEHVEGFINSPLRSRKSNIYFKKILAQSQDSLLSSLDKVVNVYQKNVESKASFIKSFQVFVFLLILALLALQTMYIFIPLIAGSNQYSEVMHKLDRLDLLTGLPNRKSFVKLGNIELDRAKRYSRPVSLLLVDIDHFKSVNDQHGYDSGDKTLLSLGNLLKINLRTIDIVGRIGGGSFALLLPETNEKQAVILADRLRKLVEVETINVGPSTNLTITVSIGVTEIPLKTAKNIEDGLKVADTNLYFAKQSGRNLVMPEAA